MYILEFLNGFPGKDSEVDWVTFEYRLLSSGVLYNGAVLATDWSKSDVTRILFRSPFQLIVCSYPFEDFPQELSLNFKVPFITEKSEKMSYSFFPDEEVASDLAALLTLLMRRLITVAGKIREIRHENYSTGGEIFRDWPIGIITTLSPVHWKYKFSTVVYGIDGVSEILDYNPPPLGVNPDRILSILKKLPENKLASSIIMSSKLYSQALQYIETDIDRAYQLFVSAIEAIAAIEFRNYYPNKEEIIRTKKSVFDLAIKYGMSNEQATNLALEASKGISWTSKKFEKFIVDYLPEQFFEEDDLFKINSDWIPARNDLEATIKLIYSARSKVTHSGSGFPPSSELGTGPTISTRVIRSFSWDSKPFPPIVWFERLVNLTINNFLDSLRVNE